MTLPLTTPDALRQLAAAAQATPCPACERLRCPGWESLSGASDASHLQPVATLRDEAIEAPTLDEHHPAGTHLWSPDAPIAPRWHPYNLCTVWQCPTCARAFLRYTEHGGYYVDERIRAVAVGLVVDERAGG